MFPRPVVLILFIVINFFLFFALFPAISGQQQIQKEISHEDKKSTGNQQAFKWYIASRIGCFLVELWPIEWLMSESHRHRWRRAPAVWGEPAPDYSMASLDHSAHIYLYTLLFVDLKTSDHYRREHGLVKREVMRLAREANNYFYQINMHLIVVDVLETFRDDLSLYSFEQYRNQRAPELPFHNFAVLITYRYAGGLAFVGGMCTTKSVMLAGFYPHNPEAMGSIFFHEVAHLIGVPHRPANESLDVPNCPCPRNVKSSPPSQFNQTIMVEPISKTSLILDGASHQFRGCLKIPGFDQDCSLQLMVNLAQRTRCLAREPRDPTEYSLPLCGNGIREGNEQCDCGLANKCVEWNCEPYTCSRRWQPHIIWLLTISLCLTIFGPLLFCCWLHLSGRYYCCCFFPFSSTSTGKHCRHRPLLSFVPPSLPPVGQKNSAKSNKLNGGTNFHRLASKRMTNLGNNGKKHSKIGQQIAKIPKMFQTIWEWLKKWNGRIWWRQRPTRLKHSPILEICNNNDSPSRQMIQRPTRAPPPPPPPLSCIPSIKSPSTSTLGGRPKRPPPPLPPPPSIIRPMIRPKVMPPAPPPLQKWNIEMDWRRKKEEKEQMAEEEDDDEDEWDDYCE